MFDFFVGGGVGRILALLSVLLVHLPMGGTLLGYCQSLALSVFIFEPGSVSATLPGPVLWPGASDNWQ